MMKRSIAEGDTISLDYSQAIFRNAAQQRFSVHTKPIVVGGRVF